jgi:hypothetical protein
MLILCQCLWARLALSVSVVTGIVEITKGKLMNQEAMETLIQDVWSDAMSDNGAIWQKSNARLNQAQLDNPDLYVKSLDSLYSRERY